MKTTGEPIKDISSLQCGDVYVGICNNTHIYISVFKEITYYSPEYDYFKILDSKAIFITDGTELVPDGLEYSSEGYTFRWPTEQELIKFGFKQRKVMFHELD